MRPIGGEADHDDACIVGLLQTHQLLSRGHLPNHQLPTLCPHHQGETVRVDGQTGGPSLLSIKAVHRPFPGQLVVEKRTPCPIQGHQATGTSGWARKKRHRAGQIVARKLTKRWAQGRARGQIPLLYLSLPIGGLGRGGRRQLCSHRRCRPRTVSGNTALGPHTRYEHLVREDEHTEGRTEADRR